MFQQSAERGKTYSLHTHPANSPAADRTCLMILSATAAGVCSTEDKGVEDKCLHNIFW